MGWKTVTELASSQATDGIKNITNLACATTTRPERTSADQAQLSNVLRVHEPMSTLAAHSEESRLEIACMHRPKIWAECNSFVVGSRWELMMSMSGAVTGLEHRGSKVQRSSNSEIWKFTSVGLRQPIGIRLADSSRDPSFHLPSFNLATTKTSILLLQANQTNSNSFEFSRCFPLAKPPKKAKNFLGSCWKSPNSGLVVDL